MPISPSELLFHEILHLREPLVGSLAYFHIRTEMGAAKKDPEELVIKCNLSQAQQERLSFIHSQGSSEDHEYDQVL